MAHAHTHEKDNNYYLEQLCTIGVSAAIGGVAIMLYQKNILRFILAEKFFIWVLVGGIALVTLVLIRAVTLWLSVKPRTHGEDNDRRESDHHHHDAASTHQHDHAHDHEHGQECVDDAGGHEHNWNPWRFAVLLIPVVLFFLDLPNQGFTNVRGIGADQVDLQATTGMFSFGAEVIGLGMSPFGTGPLTTLAALEAGNAKPIPVEFRELEQASYSSALRDHYQGRRAEVRGQFAPSGSPKLFTLVRFKITCCGADAVPLNVMIVSPQDVENQQRGSWVKAVGKIHFAKKRDQGGYVTVLQMASPKDVVSVEPPRNPYIQ